METNSKPNPTPHEEGSLLNVISLLIGLGLLAVSVLGLINTALGWNLGLKVYGTRTELPSDWPTAFGLLAAAWIWLGIWALLTKVRPIRDFGRKHPWIMAFLVIGGVVGALVAITIWDNANIEKREQEFAAKAEADSLKRIEDSKKYFGDQPVPYRLVIFNPEKSPLEVQVDGQVLGKLEPFTSQEFDLGWSPCHLTLLKEGKEWEKRAIKPDSSQKDPAAIHVFNPKQKFRLGIYDYDEAYVNGTLDKTKEVKLWFIDNLYEDFTDVTVSGPYFLMAGAPAPESSPYKVCRFIALPSSLDVKDEDPYSQWAFRQMDAAKPGASVEDPDALVRRWRTNP